MVKYGEIVVKHYCLVASKMLLVSIPTNGVVVHRYPQWIPMTFFYFRGTETTK